MNRKMGNKQTPLKWISILAILVVSLEFVVVRPVLANQVSTRLSSGNILSGYR